MQYRRSGNQVLIRVDRDEEILESIRAVCASEKIYGASFTGIGACGKAIVSSYIPEANDFTNHEASGLLELISLNGNISLENDAPFEHTCAVFLFGEWHTKSSCRTPEVCCCQLYGGDLPDSF